ncbi:PREDICTED: 30S ribosomal protein S10, chloroplastic [Camelina sativa]|uniref:30S ribosomal protein S10, chloroplastic n=1 Tax=Camelina sativa TaxID=90675 RepID=A0ABM0XJW5_CAMSA|nr:PREDICTED: 30S ribosomal protein S10, chloroplastic [Camelina sativa]XP_010487059.1 PREDICTED: 30S ribosomal protein S10, chloroplastic [Camelina sativa]
MAVSTVSSLLLPSFVIPSSSPSSTKLKVSLLPSSSSTHSGLTSSVLTKPSISFSKLFAIPETLDPTPEILDEPSEIPSSSSISVDADKMAPKQKIRIKLRSYWVPLIEDSCKQILDAARNTNAKTMGPVPLPTKKRIYCVLKSPHVHKDARFHFEIRTHQRMIDILYPTAQTIDSLMQLDLPAGVDVEVKL